MINSQLLLYLNIGFGLLVVLYIFFGRSKPKTPTKLNLRAKGTKSLEPVLLEPEIVHGGDKGETTVAARGLGVIFMYNGHDWEAHDVLGIPQGASMHDATMAYQNLIKKSDVRSLQLYEQAYAAISDRHRKHRL